VGVFANALSSAVGRNGISAGAPNQWPGLAAWLLARLRRRAHKDSRLEVVARVSLAPRQVVALIEADGQRLLVATSPEGAPVFFSLPGGKSRTRTKRLQTAEAQGKNT
jgi:flagellar biogenesis protein FliO